MKDLFGGDVSPIIDGLNDAQREAVTAPPGHALILAGAGSGKTRVLIHRLAWLMSVEQASPFSIMAVTFTNKAAAEMRSRMESLVDVPVRAMWVGTFHGIAHRLLRQHWQEAGLPQGFQILDSDDQYRLIRRVLKNLDLDEERWPPRQAQGFINSCKDEGKRPQHLGETGDYARSQMISIYAAYEEQCQRAGVVDFAELLLRAHELCRDNAAILAHYQRRFRYLLVDEFQDTNALQYAWIRLLAGNSGQVFVVGDDDQSIYSWRGAQVDNIHKFAKDFPGALTIRLEQNYRSTATILKASNALIANNDGRMGKELWTDGNKGEPIELYGAFSGYDEVRHVVSRIQTWMDQGGRRDEVAILYRSNAMSRLFEEALLREDIPYRVYGGLRFFERAEIKDALAYLRLLRNRNDDAAFERVVNTPTRGIGNTTVDKVRGLARAQNLSLWKAAEILVSDGLPARAAGALRGFIELIERLDADTRDAVLSETVEHVVAVSGLLERAEKEGGEKGQARKENLEELSNAARGYEQTPEPTDDEDEDMPELDPLTAFLTHAALEAGEHQGEAWDDCVQLMTLHSAKGLEFPMVFMVGMEEGLFPHQRSSEQPEGLEEERRLCYVGMTRAMRKLHMSYAETRRLHGSETYCSPSRFIRELPKELLNEVRPQMQVSRPSSQGGYGQYGGSRYGSSQYGRRDKQETFGSGLPPGMQETGTAGLALGQRVMHPKFGEGTILSFEGEGSRARVQINFNDAGSKWLVVGYAKLEPC